MHYLLHYLLLVATAFLFLPLVLTQSNETLLIRSLLEKQSPTARPVYNITKTIHLTFGLEMVHIVKLEERSQTIGIKVWLRMKWQNEILIWDPTKWGNITNTRVKPNLIWTPDLFLVEDVSEAISIGPANYKTHVVANSNGIHKWYVPALLDSSCRFDVENFPFDRQYCTFKFMSWSYDQSELDILLDPADMVTQYYINSSEWNLHKISNKVVSSMYNCCPNPFVHIRYTLELHRKPLYYAFNVIVPCIIQMMIILFTFFLPPDTGERVGVAVTVLLVFAVYLEVLSSSLPKTSVAIPALSKFYLSAMSGSAFSIIATCFVLVIHFKGAEKGVTPIPNWVRRYLLNGLGNCLCVRQNLREHKNDELLALLAKDKVDQIKMKWKSDENVTATTNNTCGSIRRQSIASEDTMEALIDEVRVITSLIHDQNLQDEIEEEWRILGKVFDRIFFVLFIMYFIGTSMFIFFPVLINNVLHKDPN